MSDDPAMPRTEAAAADDAVKEAVRLLGPEPIVAMVMTPRRFHMGLVIGGVVKVLTGNADDAMTAPLDEAYELRLFNAKADCHWRRIGEGGELTILPAASDPGTITLNRRYLIWGAADVIREIHGHHWACMRASRVEPVWVPARCSPRDELALVAVEHVARGIDGNAHVAFERLAGIEVAQRPKPKE